MIRVPVALLLDPEPAASAKVIWMARRLNPAASPAELEAVTGLSRHTVLTGLDHVAKRQYQRDPYAKLPSALLCDRRLGAQARVLYGLLQALPTFRQPEGEFTYADLCTFTGLGRNTIKRAVVELEVAGWLRLDQASRLSPLQFTLGNPYRQTTFSEALAAERRLQRAKPVGEALMKEYLSLLIDSDQFTDNARPGFLVNPQTGEFLEFDRFYSPSWAFEFHGAQHDGPTERFSQTEVDAQRVRDLLKAGICFYRGVHLVVIRAADLSLEGIRERIPGGLPLRDLAGHEALIDLLEESSLAYRATSASRRWTKRAPSGGRPLL